MPQTDPFIIPLTRTNPEIPSIEKGISEIPKKAYIISPGGRVGMNMVMPNRKRKDTIKTTNAFIFIEYVCKLI